MRRYVTIEANRRPQLLEGARHTTRPLSHFEYEIQAQIPALKGFYAVRPHKISFQTENLQ